MASSTAEAKWTIRPLNSTTYLIRETDEYQEYPHIYARLIPTPEVGSDEHATINLSHTSTGIAAILLIDTGCGTNVPTPTNHAKQRGSSTASSGLLSRLWPTKSSTKVWPAEDDDKPDTMTLHSFLSTWPVPALDNKPLNPNGKIPYLIAISHCHFDHIMGLTYFPTNESNSSPLAGSVSDGGQQPAIIALPKVTVMASSYDRSFIVPAYPNLNKHSLCEDVGLTLPDYEITYWVKNHEEIMWPPPSASGLSKDRLRPSIPDKAAVDTSQRTGVFAYHTPGHTPDSLTIYDGKARHMFIGDTIYERESPDSLAAGEPPMPIEFDVESNLADWFKSVEQLVRLTSEFNKQRCDDMETLVIEIIEERRFNGNHRLADLRLLAPLHPDFKWTKVSRDGDGHFTEIEEQSSGTADDGQDNIGHVSMICMRSFDPDPTRDTGLHEGGEAFRVHDRPSEDTEGWTNLAMLRRKKHLPRVKAGAAHVTAEADAEDLLRSASLFVKMVIDDKVPGHRIDNYYRPEVETWIWSYRDPTTHKAWGRFSVQAPLDLIRAAKRNL